MKKFLSLLLTLCLLLGILPSQALAYVGDILPSTGSTVTTETRADGTLVLQNDYIRVTLNKHDGSLTTSRLRRRTAQTQLTGKNHTVSSSFMEVMAMVRRILQHFA